MGKKCIACGFELDDNAVFCQSCGKKQIAEKGKGDKEENNKKKIAGCVLAVAVIGLAFIKGFSTSGSILGAMFCMAVLVLIFVQVCSMVLHVKYSKGKGIPINDGMTAEDIVNILKENLECPFLKEISINGKGKIDFYCRYGHHSAKIENNEFYIDRTARIFKDYTETAETWYLEKYVTGVLAPEAIKEDIKTLDKKCQVYIKGFKIARSLSAIVAVLLIVILGMREMGVSAYIKSGGVSHMYFDKYSESISIGEALSRVCVEGEWDKLESGGREYVSYIGENASGEELYILFEKGENSCQIVTVKIDGEDYSLLQGIFLEMLYSNALDR